MYWRRATTAAAWATALFGLVVFFALPWILPRVAPDMRTDPRWTRVSNFVDTTTERTASPADVAQRNGLITAWDAKYSNTGDDQQATTAASPQESRPLPLALGDVFQEKVRTGGKAIYWSESVVPIDDQGQVDKSIQPIPVGEVKVDGKITRTILQFAPEIPHKASGNFNVDLLIYDLLGIDLQSKSDGDLKAWALALKCVLPFFVMIGVSFITPRNSQASLDRYYAKMKTPVLPDRDEDHRHLEEVLANPAQTESLKLFPGTSLEFNKPTRVDVHGFLVCVLACFGIIGLALWVVQIGV
jgi:SSS family solute:Na+ symporter